MSSHRSVPGILKIFGSHICQGTNYKSVLATRHSSARELVKEALERYSLEKEDPGSYVLCDVIGKTGVDYEWKTECCRVVGDSERPLMLQSLWKPKEGFSRRFEIQKRAALEALGAQDTFEIAAGPNAQVRKLHPARSRVTSLFVDGSGEPVDSLGIWRSLSDMNVSAIGTKESTEKPAAPPQLEDPEADKEINAEKEETESSDDNNTQYSVHLPFDFPYFLLLQGYTHKQEFLIYLMSGNTCVFGSASEHPSADSADTLKVDILLFAPDVSPNHCLVHRLNPSSDTTEGRTQTLLRPLHGAPVSHNGVPLEDQEVELCPGDLVGLGQHYLFMFKDPSASRGFQTPSWMATLCSPIAFSPCKLCGTSLRRRRRPKMAARWRDVEGRVLALSYQRQEEEQVLEKILKMADPEGEDSKLTPAFLMCLCIQHSTSAHELVHLRRLLLSIANGIQLNMWERTKDLAALQPDMISRDYSSVAPSVMDLRCLVLALRPLVLWMSNSIELLHFIQHEVPLLLTWRQQEQRPNDTESWENQIQATRGASEEAMTVLEEVIMFTFQQTVYYLTKSLYVVLPRLLDSSPLWEEGQLHLSPGLRPIMDILKETLQLLNMFQVHQEISSQLLSYLFFFSNASLFNTLMERGSGGDFYQWSRGVQIRANLDLLMDWTQGVGLGLLAAEFFQKFSSAVNLLASPKETLLQASWSTLRAEFVHLNPAQLHHMLREYHPSRSCPPHWVPSPEDAAAALQTSHILESFDDHPPLILPSSTFHLELGKPITDEGLFAPLKRLQEFIQTLAESATLPQLQAAQDFCSNHNGDVQASEAIPCLDPQESKPHDSMTPPQVRGSHTRLSSCEDVLKQKLKCLELQNSLSGDTEQCYHKSLALDPSCLLTPPNTPQSLDLAELDTSLQEGARQLKRENGVSGNTEHRSDEEEDDRDEVFTVELQRGPHGLGLALVDGLKTPLRVSGMYVKSVVPDSPAALTQRLRVGDRILAVNGVSLVGMDYYSGREVIRTSGDVLRLLVAKTESMSSARSCITRC